MPFGLNTEPEECQRRQNEALGGLPGLKCIVDDILVYGCGETDDEAIKDHDQKVLSLMERYREKT